MDLHSGQTCGSYGSYNLVEARVHENAIFLHLSGQFFCDLANQFSLDLPGAWSKNKTYRMGSGFCRITRIFKVGVAANLDPHGGLSLAHWRAVPGFPVEVGVVSELYAPFFT